MAPNDEQSKAYCANATSDTNYYQYQVTLGQPQYWVEQTFYSLDYTERTVKNGTGVRVVFSITGVYSKFSFNAMMTTLVSIYMFFSFVTYTVDFVLLFLLPDRKLYGLSKYEVTDNFSELHASEVAKSGLKVQLEQARKVALYKQTSDVTALLNDMKAVVSPDHLDQLALACMDIFVQIKNDYPSAEQCFEQFILGDHSKCMANILLNHLREAYLVAINANSLEDVYMVLDAAKKAGNTSVEALCEKFLGSE
ncbi:hypothetical protein Pelo_17441 [Pelomyxa schiedti]|nr:hypothetical protein Pelo_17441 [Pelomyxa schiedti]